MISSAKSKQKKYELVARPSVVVLSWSHERVSVGRSPAGTSEGVVHLDPVSVPGDLGQGVATLGGANQGHGLTQPNGLTLDVTGDLWGTRRVCKKPKCEQIKMERVMSINLIF